MDSLKDFSKNHEQINSVRIDELCLDSTQLISSKSTNRAKSKHLLPWRNLIHAAVLFAEKLYGVIHIESTDDVSKHIFKYPEEPEAAAQGNNNDKDELIYPVEQVQGKSCYETESFITIESINELFHNGCGRDNNDDPESGTPITQSMDCFNAHLRSILLVIFSVFTITLLVMIRCSAYRVPSFFRHSPLLLEGFTSSLLLAVIFSLLSLEPMSMGNKFSRYFAYIAILSSAAAIGLFIALAFLQVI